MVLHIYPIGRSPTCSAAQVKQVGPRWISSREQTLAPFVFLQASHPCSLL